MNIEIKYAQVDLKSGNHDSHTYIVGDKLRLVPSEFIGEKIDNIKWENRDLVIKTDKGSIVSYNENYVISWGLKYK
jgi:hypothetical protein